MSLIRDIKFMNWSLCVKSAKYIPLNYMVPGVVCLLEVFHTSLSCSSEGVLLGCCGFHGDALTVTKNIMAQMKVLEREGVTPY